MSLPQLTETSPNTKRVFAEPYINLGSEHLKKRNKNKNKEYISVYGLIEQQTHTEQHIGADESEWTASGLWY